MRNTFILIAFPFLFLGCALHQPMSELVMFRNPQLYPDSTYRGGLGLTTLGVEFFDKKVANPRKFGGGLYLSGYRKKPNASFSISAGYAMAGVDLTTSIVPNWYMTAGVSNVGDGQLILQRVVTNSRDWGIGIGLNGRFTNQSLNSDETRIGSTDRKQYTIGLKSIIVYRPDLHLRKRDRGVYSLNVFAGYSPNNKVPMVTVALSYGTFLK